jgi:hypothetical protein
MRGLRKRYQVLLVTALAAAVVVPVGFALSIPPDLPARLAEPIAANARSNAAAPVMLSASTLTTSPGTDFSEVVWPSDAATLFVVGLALVGLASAARKRI